MRPAIRNLLALGLLLIGVSIAQAEVEPEQVFAKGSAALSDGRFEDAIDQFEALADQAAPHPDASFNRGLAYVMRVKNGAESPGDLGRAAAAFEEALLLSDHEADAAHALALVHGEVARRQARRGRDTVLARPTLDRVIVSLGSERSWGGLAIMSAFLFAAGLLLRRRPAGSVQLAGTLMTPAGGLFLLCFVPLSLFARDLRLTTSTGVLVAREAQLTAESGEKLPLEPIPEAARLEVGMRSGSRLHVRYGAREGWVQASAVRILRLR